MSESPERKDSWVIAVSSKRERESFQICILSKEWALLILLVSRKTRIQSF